MKLRKNSPTSQSHIQVHDLIARSSDSIAGNENQCVHKESLNPDIVASYTIRISFITLTSFSNIQVFTILKKLVYELTNYLT